MPAQRDGKLVVCLDESEEGVFIRGGVVGMDVTLEGARCGLASIDELLNEIIVDEVRGRGRLHDLLEEFGACPRFFNTTCEFVWWWKAAV